MQASDGDSSENGDQSKKPSRGASRRKFMPKTKTGCITCRIRRVKCDEGKPACTRCVSTGRTCDGYDTMFRNVTPGPPPRRSTPVPSTSAEMPLPGAPNSDVAGPSLSAYHPQSNLVTADDVDKLADYFSAKHRGSDIGYESEARATLTAVSDPAIRHALTALDSLHKAFAAQGYAVLEVDTSTNAGVRQGLEEYSTAVSSLAARLLDKPDPGSVRTSLLCCQLFVSIELRLSNFSLAIQHFARGLRIMHQYRCRPAVDDLGQVVPGSGMNLPPLDLFAIKLFASANPMNRQMEKPIGGQQSGTIPPDADPAQVRNQARIELATLSTQVAGFLGHVANLQNQQQVLALLQWKVLILDTLQNWHNTYEIPCREAMGDNILPQLRFPFGFALLLHQVLKLVTKLALSNLPNNLDALRFDFETLDHIAALLTGTGQVM